MYGATILAALIALIMMLAGSFVQLTPTLVIVYNLIVMGVALLIQHIKNYKNKTSVCNDTNRGYFFTYCLLSNLLAEYCCLQGNR